MEQEQNNITENPSVEESTQVQAPVENKEFAGAEAGPIMEVVPKEIQKENFFVKNKVLIGGITAGALTLTLMAFVFLPHLNKMAIPDTTGGKNITPVSNDSNQLISVLKLESGSEMPTYSMFFNNSKELENEYEVKFFAKEQELSLDEVSVEESGVRYLKGTGKYTIKLVSKDTTLTTNLEIVDTQKPSVVLKTINVNYGEEYNVKDFVNQYDDNSKDYVFTVKLKDEKQKVFNKSGRHTVSITICDSSNNCIEQRGTVVVGDKNVTLTGVKEQKITIKSEELKYGVKKVTYVNVTYNIFKDGTTEELRRGSEEIMIDQSGFDGTVETMKEEMLENYISYQTSRTAILNQTNAYRKEKGLAPLSLDKNLSEVATLRAMELAYSGSLSHTRPNGSEWNTIWEEYNGKERDAAMAENIAGNYSSDEEVCEEWYKSKSHNSIMMEDRFTKIGIGKYSFNGKTYWVQHFSE